jgi:hypothetical protein
LSPLTKLFVVFLVVLSLLTTAATVVFVNTSQDYYTKFSNLQQHATEADNARANAQAALAAAQSQAESDIRAARSQEEQARQALATFQSRINDMTAQNADLTAKLALQSGDLTRVTEALRIAQDTVNKETDTIALLRSTNDERQKQNVELNTALTEQTYKYETAERERRFNAEQLQETKRTVEKQSGIITDAGLQPKMARSEGGVRAGAPPINGVIRQTQNLSGVPYASISVGSNDGVIKGMEFKVVDRNTGTFLGFLTVDQVEATESTGRLSGPHVPDIRPGVDVRTQL